MWGRLKDVALFIAGIIVIPLAILVIVKKETWRAIFVGVAKIVGVIILAAIFAGCVAAGVGIAPF